eukprot:1142957-Pleurochrysis_carterae.AAC.1
MKEHVPKLNEALQVILRLYNTNKVEWVIAILPGVKDLNAILAYSVLLFAIDGYLLGLPVVLLLGRVQVLLGRVGLVSEGNSCRRDKTANISKA